jgi:sn-glycerol 3-phosphate transport system ATP-binding protein
VLGVRPEHVRLEFERGARADVAAIEYLGADSLVTCRLGEAVLTARVPGRVGVARGDAAWVSWPRGAQQIFERDGTRRPERAGQETATLFA